MKEAIVYMCHNHKDVLEAVELSSLDMETYGESKNKYPYYVGRRKKGNNLATVSTNNPSGAFNDEDWFKNAIEIPKLNLYQILGMDEKLYKGKIK